MRESVVAEADARGGANVGGEAREGAAFETPASGSASSGQSGAPTAGGHGSAPGEGRGDDAIDLAALHAHLAAAARGCYPPAAKRYRLTGTVPVHFCVDASGALSAIELRGTSGSSLLDRAARDCVLPGAAPLHVPPSCFDVPVAFR